jgi:hypothetical protein
MKGVIMCVAVAASLAALHAGAVAQVTLSQSVVGSGGGEPSGAGFGVVGTVGQPATGVAADEANINEIGFWYQPTCFLAGLGDAGLWTQRYWLGPGRPNPFSTTTALSYVVPRHCRVTVRIFDVAGREVMTVLDSPVPAGWHRVEIDGSGLSSGIYFCQMSAPEFTATRKLVSLK